MMNVEQMELTLTMRSLVVDKNGSVLVWQQGDSSTVVLTPSVPVTRAIDGYALRMELIPLDTISVESLNDIQDNLFDGLELPPLK